MSAAKKRKAKKSAPAGTGGLFAWLLGPGRTALIGVTAFLVLGGGLVLAWLSLKDRILATPDHLLDPGQIEITPPPDWIHSDICAEVLRDPTLDGRLSILDDGLAERIARAFARHPWVAKVVRVEPLYPSAVRVELEYRRPVCMVEVPGGLLPVDANAVLLPEGDFSPVEKTRYPLLTGVAQMPIEPPGSRWPDAKIIGGAEIAAAIGPAWETMRLHQIVPLASDPAAAAVGGGASRRNGIVGGDSSRRSASFRSAEPFFELVTGSGTQILWGYAPGAGAIGELPAAEKVARLKLYLAKNDTFDGRDGRRQVLDVRTMPATVEH